MSTLLHKLNGNMTLNGTIFPPFLYVYDDLLVYRKRAFFVVNEITISYHHIGQFKLKRGIFFSSIEIETTTSDTILIKWVNKKDAIKAKRIIDQKIYHSHAKHQASAESTSDDVKNTEKAISRLKELAARGKISQKEFAQKRDKVLKEL